MIDVKITSYIDVMDTLFLDVSKTCYRRTINYDRSTSFRRPLGVHFGRPSVQNGRRMNVVKTSI